MNYTLLPLVKSPHQFVAQGVEEMRVFNLDHLDRMGSATVVWGREMLRPSAASRKLLLRLRMCSRISTSSLTTTGLTDRLCGATGARQNVPD